MLTSPLLAAALTAALSVEATPLAGEPVSGELQSLSPQKLVIATADGPREFALPTLRAVKVVGAESKIAEPVIEIRLRDESRLLSPTFTTTDSAAISVVGIPVEAPLDALHWVRLQSLDKEEEAQKEWLLLLDKPAQGDRLVTTRRVDGDLVVDSFTGTLFDVGEERIQFSLDGDRVEPKRSKALGLIYLPGRKPVADRIASVKLVDGSVLSAADLELKDGALRVKTGAGLEVELPLDKMAGLELGTSNITFLSDTKPTAVECEPYFGVVLESERRAYLPRMDEDHHGDPLKIPGQDAFPKGLALRSYTKLVYRLEKPYQRMQATVGIAEHVLDSEVTPHLKLVISSDDKTLLDREIKGTDDPFELDLDLKGVQRLTIEVQYGNSQDIADYLHLCNARLLK